MGQHTCKVSLATQTTIRTEPPHIARTPHAHGATRSNHARHARARTNGNPGFVSKRVRLPSRPTVRLRASGFSDTASPNPQAAPLLHGNPLLPACCTRAVLRNLWKLVHWRALRRASLCPRAPQFAGRGNQRVFPRRKTGTTRNYLNAHIHAAHNIIRYGKLPV